MEEKNTAQTQLQQNDPWTVRKTSFFEDFSDKDFEDKSFSGSSFYVYDDVTPKECLQSYIEDCAHLFKINSSGKWIMFDLRNLPTEQQNATYKSCSEIVMVKPGIMKLPIVNGISFELKNKKVEIRTNIFDLGENWDLGLYLDEVCFYTNRKNKEADPTNKKDKNKKRKKTMESCLISLEYEGPQSGTFEDLISRGEIRMMESSMVEYFPEIIKEVLFERMPVKSKTESEKRKLLFDFLEKNKNNGSTIKLDTYVKSFGEFIERLQGNETEIDDLMYMEILFHAYKYDCLNLMTIDKDRIKEYLTCLTEHKLKILKEAFSIIVKEPSVNFEENMNRMFSLDSYGSKITDNDLGHMTNLTSLNPSPKSGSFMSKLGKMIFG